MDSNNLTASLKDHLRCNVMHTETRWTVTTAENDPETVLIGIDTKDGTFCAALSRSEAIDVRTKLGRFVSQKLAD